MWQRFMIALAKNKWLSHTLQNNQFFDQLAYRFVGGHDIHETLNKAETLANQQIKISIYYLGEYVSDETLIEQNVEAILTAIDEFGKAGKEIHISVDPTQIGYAASDDLGWSNAQRIADALKQHPTAKFLMLDMEDHSYLEKTLALYQALQGKNLPVAITLQAYLYRTMDDVKSITQQPAAIRLVKGAFAENRQIAWTKKQDIDTNYFEIAKFLLQPAMRECNIYPIFATHDHHLIERIKPLLNGWQPHQYEFEMLLGVREPLQQQLVQSGHPLRLYVPFGTEWWAYTARRIGENPANLRFVGRALIETN